MKVTVKVREFCFSIKDDRGEIKKITIGAENRTAAEKIVKQCYSGFKSKFTGMNESKLTYEISVNDIIEHGSLIEGDSDF